MSFLTHENILRGVGNFWEGDGNSPLKFFQEGGESRFLDLRGGRVGGVDPSYTHLCIKVRPKIMILF